ncbi:MAG: purine-binding chemotaxis protein CheW [Nitrospinae bacterium]|nr:purine-binding chemotaxis protein CheW [Nitrospinota bacterium]
MSEAVTGETGVKASEYRVREGKYLTFVLGEEEYGLDITKVKEIMGVMDITHIPKTPPFIKGVINLRGKVIPVIDLRLKFGMEEAEYTRETVFIVVEVAGVQMGIIVDTVREVLDIHGTDIEAPPQFGSRLNTDFILGMGKVQGKVKILLDIDKVLSTEEESIPFLVETPGMTVTPLSPLSSPPEPVS